MAKIPKLKKKISAYVLGEEGKISKQVLIAMGVFLGSGVLSSILMSDEVLAQNQHTNSFTNDYDSDTGIATATHTHHASHSSHSSY